MKRLKKILISLVITLTISNITPIITHTQNFTPSATYVQAKTSYVYVTPTGKKYHSRKCGKGTYSKTTLKKAKSKGLTPCKKCYK